MGLMLYLCLRCFSLHLPNLLHRTDRPLNSSIGVLRDDFQSQLEPKAPCAWLAELHKCSYIILMRE